MQIQPINTPIQQNINTQRISQPQYRQLPQHDTVSFGSIFSIFKRNKPPIPVSLDNLIAQNELSKAKDSIQNEGKTPEELLEEAKKLPLDSDRFKQIAWEFQIMITQEGDPALDSLLADICERRGNMAGVECLPTAIENGKYITKVLINKKLSFQIVDGVFQEAELPRIKQNYSDRLYKYAKDKEEKAIKEGKTSEQFRNDLVDEIFEIEKSKLPHDPNEFRNRILILQILHLREHDQTIAKYLDTKKEYPNTKSHFKTYINDDLKLVTQLYQEDLNDWDHKIHEVIS